MNYEDIVDGVSSSPSSSSSVCTSHHSLYLLITLHYSGVPLRPYFERSEAAIQYVCTSITAHQQLQSALQVDSHDPTRVDLARSYYSVFYDLVCKENAVLGRACVSPTVMEEAKARLEVLNRYHLFFLLYLFISLYVNRNQDQERMNFLHQLQNMHVVKVFISSLFFFPLTSNKGGYIRS